MIQVNFSRTLGFRTASKTVEDAEEMKVDGITLYSSLWVYKLWTFCIIPLKLFVKNVTWGYYKHMPMYACQSFFITAGDLLVEHPFTTYFERHKSRPAYNSGVNKLPEVRLKFNYPMFNYRQARLLSLRLNVNSVGLQKFQSGKLVIATVACNQRSLEGVTPPDSDIYFVSESRVYQGDELSFDQIAQIPGSMIMSLPVRKTIVLPVQGWTAGWYNIGSSPKVDYGTTSFGIPLFKIYIGFENANLWDVSVSRETEAQLMSASYGPEVATFSLTFEGSLELQEPGNVLLPVTPIVNYDVGIWPFAYNVVSDQATH